MAHLSSDSHTRAAMMFRILSILGLSAAVPLGACGGDVVVEGGPGGAGGDETGGTGGGSTVTPQPGCALPAEYEIRHECLPTPTVPAPCPSAEAAKNALWELIQGSDGCQGSGSCCDVMGACGPDPEDLAGTGQCCYDIAVYSYGCEGRPFIDGGEVRTAGITRRADWQRDMPSPAPSALDAATRAAIALRYREAALFEHASVASFARFALELLGLGAPADLVAAAHRAMGDEIRHAELCFSLASAHAGEALGPSPLPLGQALSARPAAELAAAVAFEGCINETISALIAAAEHERASDPAARAALGSIAADEAEHAELAWRSLAWLLSIGGEAAARAVGRVFASPPRFEPRDLPTSGADAEALAAHGCLTLEERRAIADAAMRDVVSPCARALLSRPAFPLPEKSTIAAPAGAS